MLLILKRCKIFAFLLILIIEIIGILRKWVDKVENNKLIIETTRESYSINSVNSITIGELIKVLEYYGEYNGLDAEVVLSFDNGYTYGGIHERDIRQQENGEE